MRYLSLVGFTANKLLLLLLLAMVISCSEEETGTVIPQGGSATKLWFASVPAGIIAQDPFSVTVHALRTDNIIDASFTGLITIAKGSGPGKMNGTLTKNAVGGVATFAGLTVDDDGDYTFRASSNGLSSAATDVIHANPAGSGPAIKLGFVQVPALISEMTPFTLTVQAQHGDNSVDPDYTGTITISQTGGPGTLSGVLSRTAVNGEAVFTDLSVSSHGVYYFSAVSDTLDAGSSGPVLVAPLVPTVVGTGIFAGQNGYVTSGTVDVVFNPDGSNHLMTRDDFAVTSTVGNVQVWLTDGAGAMDLNTSSVKTLVGTIVSGFSGAYEFPIPSDAGNYTHVVTFSEGLLLNLGNAELTVP
jgi:hypothetical protein